MTCLPRCDFAIFGDLLQIFCLPNGIKHQSWHRKYEVIKNQSLKNLKKHHCFKWYMKNI